MTKSGKVAPDEEKRDGGWTLQDVVDAKSKKKANTNHFKAYINTFSSLADHNNIWSRLLEGDLAECKKMVGDDKSKFHTREASTGATPFLKAVLYGQKDIYNWMLSADPSVAVDAYIAPAGFAKDNPGPYDGENALMLAIIVGASDLAMKLVESHKELLDAEPSGTFFEYRLSDFAKSNDKENWSSNSSVERAYVGGRPFCWAISMRDKKMCSFLLDPKNKFGGFSNLFKVDKFQNSPFHVAALKGDAEMMDFLIKKADRYYRTVNSLVVQGKPTSDIELQNWQLMKNQDELTPLGIAEAIGDKKFLSHMVSAGGNLLWKFGALTCRSIPLEQLDPLIVRVMAIQAKKAAKDTFNADHSEKNGKGTSTLSSNALFRYVSTKKLVKENGESLRDQAHLMQYLDEDGKVVPVTNIFHNTFERKNTNLALFQCETVRELIDTKWNAYGFKWFLRETVYMGLFMAAWTIVYIFSPKDGESKKVEDMYGFSTTNSIVRIFAEVVVLALMGLSLLFKLSKYMRRGSGATAISQLYGPVFSHFICNVLLLVGIVCMFAFRFMALNRDNVYEKTAAAWFTVVLYTKAIISLTAFKRTGPHIVMMYRMIVGDIFNFLIVYVLALGCFATAIGFVTRKNTGQITAVLYAVSMGSVSMYEFDDYVETEYQSVTVQILLLVFVAIVTIMLLNMLIALMGNTVSNVGERSLTVWYMLVAQIMYGMDTQMSESSVRSIMEKKTCYWQEVSGAYFEGAARGNFYLEITGQENLSVQEEH